MAGKGSHRGVKARIRGSFHTDVSVVVSVGKEPFYRVVSVRGFVNNAPFRRTSSHAAKMRTDVLEISFTQEGATDVLQDNNIAIRGVVEQVIPDAG